MNNKNIENNIPSITSLHQERVVKQNSKIDIFNIVLNKCIEKIVYTNRHTDKTFIIFEVPKILIGYPGYDMKSCILFLINRLSGSSYLVEFIEPFYLYIDWGSQKQIKPSKKVNSNYDKLQSQTKALLHKFPNTSKVEYVYEDMYKGNVSSK
jgi:hypothetical protein